MYENVYVKGVNMKRIIFMAVAGFLVSGLMGCSSMGEPQSSRASTSQRQPQQQGETQSEKFQRLLVADNEKLVIGSDGKATIESIETVLQPQIISGIGEITEAKLSEPGYPYYFKLRAIYKGYDASAERVRLQDSKQKQSDIMDNAMRAVFGVDTDVYSVLCFDAVLPTLPTEANSIATFYLIALRLTEYEGTNGNETGIYIRFVRNIEPSPFDPAEFIVASGMHYITVEDAHSPTQRDVMIAYFSGGNLGNSTSSVFDPVVYPLVDLMDARAAMDKKDIRNDYTLPTVKVKYVSEAVFKGQSNTTITVSTGDNILTERMSFAGRASSVKSGDTIRVYYTIAKDPLEKWELQAIERL
jgi:hypothetical protein